MLADGLALAAGGAHGQRPLATAALRLIAAIDTEVLRAGTSRDSPAVARHEREDPIPGYRPRT